METYELKVIARIHTDLPEKFGLPRQSGLIPELRGRIVFEPEYRSVDAVRGVEGYSHLWLIYVRGVDLMDGTPIFDIKPYLAYADSHPDAVGGWTDVVERKYLQVECREELLEKVHPAQHKALLAVLANDPRPRYQDDPQRIYGLTFAQWNVKFRVEGETLHVTEVEAL